MKKITLLLNCIFALAIISSAQAPPQLGGTTSEVPLGFYGVNGWMNQKVGNGTDVFDCNGLSLAYVNTYTYPIPCLLYGSVDVNGSGTGIIESCPSKITDLYLNVIRYGGTANDFNMPTRDQYINEIDRIRSLGAEPIIQIPYGEGKYTVADAYNLLYYLNTTRGKNIKYVEIANEPDRYHSYIALGNNPQAKANLIANYFRLRADTLKVADPNIKIIGPSNSWYDATVYTLLLDSTNSTAQLVKQNSHGKYRLDIVDFHNYAGFTGTQTRAQVIQNPRSYLDNSILGSGSTTLVHYMDNANTSRSSKLQFSISEMNINIPNPAANGPTGVGANSFLAGQWMAESYSVILDKAN